jgi:peptidyl-prolyl cis-trans isomerase C
MYQSNHYKKLLAGLGLSMICLVGLLSPAQAAKPVKANKIQSAAKERLVLMPLRLGEEDQKLQGAMETALIEGLQQKYEVFSGEQVAKKAREIFMKESKNTAHKECDETRCLQGIAESFQSELLAIANITKDSGGYFLALSIRNLYDNKDVYSKSLTCRGCDSFQAVDKLKELVGTPASEEPTSKTTPNDAESEVWGEVQKGNSKEDYQAYITQYPKGKYLMLAKIRIKKLEEQADAEHSQQDKLSWESANTSATVASYQNYLDSYPTGQFAALAQARIAKLKREATQAQPQAAAEPAQSAPVAARASWRDLANSPDKSAQQPSSTANSSTTIATVNGAAIPQLRMDLRIKASMEQGQKDSPELRTAIRDDLINLEAISQEALKKGFDRQSDITQQIELSKQSVLAGAFVQDYTKARLQGKNKQEQQQAIQEAIKSLRANARIDTDTMTVNGVVIPQARIENRIKVTALQGKTDSPEWRKAVKDDLVNLEVLSQEAIKTGLDRQPEVAQQIELAKQSALTSVFVQDYVKSHPITEEVLQQEYENLKTRVGSKEYKVSHILVASENEALTIAAELKKGRSFDKIAKEKSQDPGSKDKGGDLGWTVPSNFVQPFGDAIHTLAKGEISAPVQTQFGWHIIKLDDIRNLKIPAYLEVKANLEKRLQQQALQEVIKSLRANVRID